MQIICDFCSNLIENSLLLAFYAQNYCIIGRYFDAHGFSSRENTEVPLTSKQVLHMASASGNNSNIIPSLLRHVDSNLLVFALEIGHHEHQVMARMANEAERTVDVVFGIVVIAIGKVVKITFTQCIAGIGDGEHLVVIVAQVTHTLGKHMTAPKTLLATPLINGFNGPIIENRGSSVET